MNAKAGSLEDSGHLQKSVLITGAASGIGAACADRFVAAGWKTYGWDLAPGNNDAVEWSHVDTTDWDGVARASAEISSLDALVNCAGISPKKSLLELERDEWDRVISTNLSGYYYVSRFNFESLRCARGVVINIGSINATTGFRNRAPYSSAKAGVLKLSQCMAIEWGEFGIRVVCVSPGYTVTPTMLKGLREGRVNQPDVLRHTPLARFVEPQEIGEVVFALTDPRFGAITGSNVLVDAGFDAYSGL